MWKEMGKKCEQLGFDGKLRKNLRFVTLDIIQLSQFYFYVVQVKLQGRVGAELWSYDYLGMPH